MTKMFALLGDTPEQAATEAADVHDASRPRSPRAPWPASEMRDPAKRYHIMTVAELQALSPDYDWKQSLDGHRARQACRP